MTREEEIIKQGIFYTSQICPACISGDDPFNEDVRDLNRNKAFEAGAKWADEHPINVWHNASEEPQEYPILCQDVLTNVWVEYSLKDFVDGWTEFIEFNDIAQWAYIDDLLPSDNIPSK